MPVTTVYNINASGGAWVTIPCTIPCRRVEIIEDESVTPQGLQYKLYRYANDAAPQAQVYTIGASTEPIVLGNTIAHEAGRGGLLGLPAQPGRAADNYIQLQSKTATATVVRVTEIE